MPGNYITGSKEMGPGMALEIYCQIGFDKNMDVSCAKVPICISAISQATHSVHSGLHISAPPLPSLQLPAVYTTSACGPSTLGTDP